MVTAMGRWRQSGVPGEICWRQRCECIERARGNYRHREMVSKHPSNRPRVECPIFGFLGEEPSSGYSSSVLHFLNRTNIQVKKSNFLQVKTSQLA